MIEDTVRAVELSTLKSECPDAIGPYSDKVVEDDRRGRVMCPIVVFIE